jgi:hypothetical protein
MDNQDSRHIAQRPRGRCIPGRLLPSSPGLATVSQSLLPIVMSVLQQALAQKCSLANFTSTVSDLHLIASGLITRARLLG